MSLFTADISKKKTLLFFYGLLLLLVIEVSATTENSQEGTSQAKILIDKIPRIINELNRLTNSTIQQLDTALFWSTEVLKKNESYTNPFVMEMNQKLTKVLRLIKNNSERIALQVLLAPSKFNTLNRYPSLHSQRRNDYLHLLNELKEFSKNILLLSKESSSELQQVADFTKAFGETTAIHSAKLGYMKNKINLDEITNQRNEVEKEIVTLKEEVAKLIRNYTELREKWKEEKKKNLKWNEIPFRKTETAQGLLRVHRNVRVNMTTIARVLATKREIEHNLSITFQKLEFKKNKLVMDISLLENTKNSIDKLGKEMEKLTVGWNNLANDCQNIESVVAAVSATLSSGETAIPVNGTKPFEDVDYSYEDPISTQSVTTTTPAPQNELTLCIKSSTLNIVTPWQQRLHISSSYFSFVVKISSDGCGPTQLLETTCVVFFSSISIIILGFAIWLKRSEANRTLLPLRITAIEDRMRAHEMEMETEAMP